MGFAGPGGIPHATGENKPWRRHYLIDVLFGEPPRQVDKVYWGYADAPIAVASKSKLWRKKLELTISSLIGRFYSRR